jgi:tyrosyl-tRNA synthetase
MMTLFDELSWRGLVYDATDGVEDLLKGPPVTAYNGIDPTASSLHVGHLLGVIVLARLQRFGHRGIAVIGGATGMIGDPSGKSQERVLLDRERLEANVAGIRTQLGRLLDLESAVNPVRLVNNADWLGTIDLVSFLRDVGKHFTVSAMLQKESISRRIESEEGISYTEFSYVLLQAYDFLHVFDTLGCSLQVGGSDQWGNITAGIDLIRRVRSRPAHALVWPLMLTSAGTKFGKTEAGAVWLDPKRTSPFRFYQFWLNTDDQDVMRFLKFFTFLDRATIEALGDHVRTAPEKRDAQRVLAREVTTLVHGVDQAERAARASAVLFGGDLSSLSADDVLAVFDDVPSTEVAARDVGEGIGIVDLVARVGLAPSRAEARRLVESGGVYVNNQRTADPRMRLSAAQAIEGRLFVLRKGPRQNHVVRLV